MKNKHYTKLRQMQKEYHKRNPWNLSKGGLFVPHSYEEKKELSYWDDVGFVLNGRRVMVWYEHPRCVYLDAIEELADKEMDKYPMPDFLGEGKKIYKKLGKSRKKLTGSFGKQPTNEESKYWDDYRNALDNLMEEGIDFEAKPSFLITQMTWAVGVDITAPIEVRNEEEVANLVSLVRRILTNKTTIEKEFPSYVYTKKDWLNDRLKEVKHESQKYN